MRLMEFWGKNGRAHKRANERSALFCRRTSVYLRVFSSEIKHIWKPSLNGDKVGSLLDNNIWLNMVTGNIYASYKVIYDCLDYR